MPWQDDPRSRMNPHPPCNTCGSTTCSIDTTNHDWWHFTGDSHGKSTRFGQKGGPDPSESGKRGGHGKTKEYKHKEKVFMQHPKKPDESYVQYVNRLFEEGHLDPLKSAGLIAKMIDKEKGNAPQVSVNLDGKDIMTDAEVDRILQEATDGKVASMRSEDDEPPTKH